MATTATTADKLTAGMTMIGGAVIDTIRTTESGSILVTFVGGGHNGFAPTGRVYVEA